MKNFFLPLLPLALALQACGSLPPSAPEQIQSVTFQSWNGTGLNNGSDFTIKRDLTTDYHFRENEQQIHKVGNVTQAQFDHLVHDLENADYTHVRHQYRPWLAAQGAGSTRITIQTDKHLYQFNSNNTSETFPPEMQKLADKWLHSELLAKSCIAC